jgi:CheY-like chemotaxis protein
MATVMIVDDYEGWRSRIRQLLQKKPELQVICEVSDGLTAVEKAAELKPDLIILDVGLPKLNGIEVARRIGQLSPSSKIIISSQDKSFAIVQAALSTGAGYVYKLDVRRDLLTAIEAILDGKPFVSSTIATYEFTQVSAARVPNCHKLLLFSDDTIFLSTFARLVAAALKAHNLAIAVVTKSHQEGFLRELKAESVDLDGADQQGTFILLDVDDILATVWVDGLPDRVRFVKVLSHLIDKSSKAAKAERPRITFCCECIGRLWAEGKTDAAVRLEQACNDLAKKYDIDLLCAYPLRAIHGNEDNVMEGIYAEHSAAFTR